MGVSKAVAEKTIKALLKGIESSVVKGDKVTFAVRTPGGEGNGGRGNEAANESTNPPSHADASGI